MRNAVFSIVLLKYINISIDLLILSCLVLACLVLSGLVWSNFSHFIYIYIYRFIKICHQIISTVLQ